MTRISSADHGNSVLVYSIPIDLRLVRRPTIFDNGRVIAYENTDAQRRICVCEVAGNVVLRRIKECEGERTNEDGGLEVCNPC